MSAPTRFSAVRFSARHVLAVTMLVLLGACAPVYQGEPILDPLDTSDPQVALGERVFATNCNLCHPTTSKGIGLGLVNKPLPGFVIRAQVRSGVGQMPAFTEAEISDEELDAIVAYIDAVRARLAEQRPVQPNGAAP